MKRKIFSILFALVLVCSFSLVTAVPAPVMAEEGTNYSPFGTVHIIWGANQSTPNVMKWFYLGNDGALWDGHKITIVNSKWPEFDGQWYMKNTGAVELFTLWQDYDEGAGTFSNQVTTTDTGYIGGVWGDPAAYAIDGWVEFDPEVDTVGDPRETVIGMSHMYAGGYGGVDTLQVSLPVEGDHLKFQGWYLDLVECGWTDLNGGWFLNFHHEQGAAAWYELYADAEFTQIAVPDDPSKFVPYGGVEGYLKGGATSGRFVAPYEVWVDDGGDDGNPGTEDLPFATIQKGIDMVAVAGTVNVGAGTYDESVVVDKSLTLNGARPGESAVSRTGDESEIVGGITVSSGVSDFTIDGFKITQVANNMCMNIESASATIINNIIVAVKPPGGYATNLVYLNGVSTANIQYNDFSGEYNDITRPNVLQLVIAANASTVTVANNEMHDVGGGGGIAITGNGADAVIEIIDNVIDNTGDGIWTFGPAFGTLLITGNDIVNCHDSNLGGAGSYIGVKVAGGVTGDVQIHNNNIKGNEDYGVFNDPSNLLVDATNNWWGSASGPTHASNTYTAPGGAPQGNAVSDLVDFVPWLDGPSPEGKDFAPVTLDDPAGQFSSIQAAIDGVGGTTITCAAGTYTENPLVEKGVVLQGESGAAIKGTIKIAADGVTVDGFSITDFDDAWYGTKFWGIFIFSGTGITVSNNVIDGAACLDPVNPTKNVIGIETCSGSGAIASIEGNNTIKNTRLGISINAGNTLTITGNTIEDTVKGIITCNPPLTATITENIIRNNEIGIEVYSAENVAIHYNNFCGNSLYGVKHIGPLPIVIVDATNNYWCDPSGPSHSPGYGNPVSDNVLYDPWLLGPVVPGEPPPKTFDKTLALNIGWTLVSTDNWIDPDSAVGVGVKLAFNYIPGQEPGEGWSEVDPTAIVPVNALYVKTDIGGALGFDYSGGVPIESSKDLVTGWNLISSATIDNAKAILSPLRWIDVGDEQGVGLTTLVSQGDYNQHTVSFTLATLDSGDWAILGTTELNPFDGYWVYMNAGKSFGVVPGAQP